MKVAKVVYLIFFVFILIFFCILWFFFATDRGVYLMLSNLTSHVSGLKIGSVSGNLLHGVTIKDLHYHKYGTLIRSSELHIFLDFRNLLSGSFGFRSLFVKNLFIHVDIGKFNRLLSLVNDTQRSIVHIIKMYPIVFRNVTLHDIYIELGDSVILLNRCNTALTYSKKTFTVSSTFFSGLEFVNFVDFARIKNPVISEISLRNYFCKKSFLFNDSSLFSFLKFLSFKFFCKKNNLGDLTSYNFILDRVEGEHIVFSGKENFLIKKLCIQGIISREYIRIALLDMFSSYGVIRVSGSIKLNEEYLVNLIVNFRSDFSLLDWQCFNFFISGSLYHTLYVYSDFSGVVNGYLIVKLELDKFGVPLRVILNVDSLNGSLIDSFDYVIQKLRFTFNGSFNDYKLHLESIIFSKSSSFSTTNIVMNAVGNINNLNISDLNIQSANVVLDIGAVIDNYNNFNDWNIKLIVKKCNIIQCSFIWPMCLFGEINAKINLFDHDNYYLRFFDIFFQGRIRDSYSVNLRGVLFRNSFDNWNISKFFLSVGENILRVNKNLKDTSIIIGIDFPYLNNVFSTVNGNIFGSIKVDFKSFENFSFLTDITVKSLLLIDKNLKIDRFFLKSDIQYYKILQGNFKCELDRLIYDSLFLSKLVFQIIGDTTSHNLKISIYTSLFKIILNASGFFDFINKNWCGNISKIHLFKQIVNDRLDEKLMNFYRKLPNQFVFLDNNLGKCFFRVRYCGGLKNQGIKKFIRYFQDAHLKIEQSFILRSSDINGLFIFDVDLIWDNGSFLPFGKIYLSSKGVELNSMLSNEKSLIIFGDFIVNVILEKEYVLFDWLCEFSNFSRCSGNFKILLFNQNECSGNLFVRNFSLFFLNIFLDSDGIVEGAFDSDLKITGSLLYPEIDGNIKITNLIFRGSQIPFIMQSSKLLLNFVKNHSILSGVINTTHGKLYLNGNIYWNHIQSICSRICITGHNVRLRFSSTINMDISPVITFEMSPSLFVLKGAVNVPWAYIGWKEHDQYIDVSSDEVVINENFRNKFLSNKENGNFFITTIINVMVSFNGDVGISAFGLDAKLRGNLNVVYDKYGLGLKGYINLPKGNFNIYGQTLFIKKGQLLFSGLIGSEPYLNIEAVRNPEWIQNVIAGIRITGFVSSPEIEVFSDHAMSQEEAMSYLLSGQRLNILNMNGSNMIRSILVRFGLFHSERFIKQFGGTLGIKDLLLSTNGFGSSSEVVLSGYVSPGLQVKYGIGIFDSLATITIRYSLLSNFYFELISGKNKMIDLVYQFKY